MAANREHDVLNVMLDEALSACANPDPPRGMEARIVARLARKKAKSGEAIRVACLVFAVTLLGIVMLKPADSVQPEVRDLTPPAAIPDLLVSQPEVHIVATESELPDLQAELHGEHLISDIEIEPLSIAALDLPALEH